MMLDIKPVRNNQFNCYDNNIIKAISDYWNKDYSYYFLGDFTFHFYEEKSGNLAEDCISTYNAYSDIILKEIVGISIREQVKAETLKQFIDSVQEQLSNKSPVGVCLDSYYCPWNEYYLQSHQSHYFLITGVEESSNCFYCVDSYFSETIEKMDVQAVYQYYEKLYFFQNDEKKQLITDEMIYSAIWKTMRYEQDNKNREPIRKLADVLRKSEWLIKEYNTSEKVNQCAIIFRISSVQLSRVNFMDSLKRISGREGFSGYTEIVDDFTKVCKQWKKVKNFLVKSCIIGDAGSLEKVYKNLYEVADAEEYILEKLFTKSQLAIT